MDKDETGYDFKSEENSRKWQGLFLGALKQIQKQVHPTLVSKDDGLLYVESLILRLLNSIINSQNKAVGNTSTAVTFHQHADVEAQIKRLFPQPLDRWSMKRAHEILAQLKHHKRSHRALAVTGAFSGGSSSSSFSSDRSPPLKTPVDKFHQLLQKELLHHKTDISVSQYILAVLEYIAKDILQLSGHYVRNMTHTEITSQDIRVAMCADKVLMDLFYSDLDEVALGPPPSAGWASGPSGGGGGSVGSGDGGGGNSGGGVYGNSGGGQAFRFDAEALEFGAGEYGNIGARPTYLDAVKELIREERQFGRDLNLIIKVFRDPLVGVLTPAEIERFFGNIDEVLEFSTDFLFSLEDAIELADEEDCPIGACFEDIAEEQAFDVFEKYAAMIMPLALRDELYFIFKREDVAGPLTQRLGEQMMAAMRYVLPQLLLVPIHHCVNSYFKAVANLKELTTSKEDRDSFEQAEALMLPLRSQLAKLAASNKKMGEAYFLRLNGRTNRATALAKMTDIQRAIDGWEGKDIGQSCNEFIMEGPLSKEAGQGGIGHRGSAHRLTERHGFLFDGLLVLCKPNISKRGTAMSVTAAVTGRDPPSSAYDWRLKERFLIRNIEIADRGGDEYREERKRERERKEEEERLKKEKKMEMGEEMGEEMEEKEQQQQQEKDPETGNSSFYVPATPATPSSSSSAAFSASSSTLNTLVSEHSPLVPETSAPASSTAENSSSASSANPNSNGNNGKDNQNPNSSTTAASNSTTTTPLSDFIHAFEIKSRPNLQSSGIVLVTKTPEEKDRWMSQLILLNTRSMLERTLDSRLQEEAKKHPLQLPHPSHYRFATEDFDTNIIFEETRSSMLSSSSSSNVPLIKGATLLKLIERLTYHKYGDPALVRTFLTTYRSFCTPTELLKLLIERFEIPNPDLSSCLQAMHFANQELASPTSIHPSMGGLNHQQNHLQHQQNHHQHQNHQSEAIVGSPVTASSEETAGGVQENSATTAQGPPTSPISPTTSIMSDFSSNTFTFLTGAEEGGNTPADTEQQQRDYTEMVKKFRKEYAEPVQFRVMNVLRHWIENHYYDFERDPSLLEALTEFLERKKRPQPSTASASSAPNGPTTTTTATTSSSSLNLESMSIVGGSMISLLLKSGPESVQAVPRTMRKLIEHLTKVIDRKKDQASKQKETSREIMHNSVAPAIEWWLTREEEEFDLLTLHPVEIARQLTLLEFELYCAVKPSELVGTEQGKTGVWTKKDKQKTSPNLLKLIYHNSNFTYYLEKCIIEAENFEERVAILLRIIEIMIVLQELNNFNGVIEVMSALHSASVFRLEHTMARIESNSKLKKAFDEGLELMQDHFKKYQDKLRSINPPCVPFFGTYLTNILHLEEGNPEYLSPPQHLENMSLHDTSGILSDEAVNCKLINFSKKRKVAEITGEIQQYQNQPYCLKVEPTIRHFLENLAPHTGMTEREFDDYLYTRSMVIEPRGAKQPVKNPRKWPSRQLKSPGIKTVKQRFIPLMSIDPLISNFTSYAHNHGSSSHHHQNSGQQNSTPNSANSQHQHPDLDSLSQQISPPTPLTPPHSATSFHHHSHSHSHQSHHSHHRHNHHHHSRHNSNNDTIFANVIIGGGGQRDGPSASPTTPVHHSNSSTTSNCFNFPVSGQSPAGQLPDGSFLPTPPPLPPRTNRGGMNSSVLLQQQQQSPRTRFPPFPPPSALAYSEGGNNEGFSSPISNNSNSPPPLPPRSHLSGGGTLSRSTSLAQAVHSLREPPPVPSQPHPSSSSHHGTPPPPPLPPFGGALPPPPPSSLPPFVQHQRVSSDITSLSSSSTNGGVPTTVGGPILRRNSTLEPIPSSKRYSHGNPPPPLPSMQGGASSASGPSSSSSPSPLHTPLLTPPSASSLTPLHHPPPPHSSLQSPSSSSSTLAMSPGGGGGGGGSLGGVPELPPKTYRLSSACRLTEEVLAKTTYPSSTMTNK